MRRWLVMLLFRINIGEAGNEAYKLGSAFPFKVIGASARNCHCELLPATEKSFAVSPLHNTFPGGAATISRAIPTTADAGLERAGGLKPASRQGALVPTRWVIRRGPRLSPRPRQGRSSQP